MKEDTIIRLIESFLKENYNNFSILPDQREKAVLALREQGKTLQSIGDQMNITRERVRQLEVRANERITKGDDMARELYRKIKLFFFDEAELEDAFLNWYSDVLGRDIFEAKEKWRDFNKLMWDKKQNDLHTTNNNNN